MIDYQWRQRVIAVRNGPWAILEWLVPPGTEAGMITKYQDRGWTCFAYGKPFRAAVLTPDH